MRENLLFLCADCLADKRVPGRFLVMAIVRSADRALAHDIDLGMISSKQELQIRHCTISIWFPLYRFLSTLHCNIRGPDPNDRASPLTLFQQCCARVSGNIGAGVQDALAARNNHV